VTETTTEPEAQPSGGVQRVTVATLTAMVVGGMVGAGVFSLPRRFAT
jgi:arginine:ornithine antiporter/lysine permease